MPRTPADQPLRPARRSPCAGYRRMPVPGDDDCRRARREPRRLEQWPDARGVRRQPGRGPRGDRRRRPTWSGPPPRASPSPIRTMPAHRCGTSSSPRTAAITCSASSAPSSTAGSPCTSGLTGPREPGRCAFRLQAIAEELVLGEGARRRAGHPATRNEPNPYWRLDLDFLSCPRPPPDGHEAGAETAHRKEATDRPGNRVAGRTPTLRPGPDLAGRLVASMDGLLIVHDTHDTEPEGLAAMTAASLGLAQRLADATGQGSSGSPWSAARTAMWRRTRRAPVCVTHRAGPPGRQRRAPAPGVPAVGPTDRHPAGRPDSQPIPSSDDPSA